MYPFRALALISCALAGCEEVQSTETVYSDPTGPADDSAVATDTGLPSPPRDTADMGDTGTDCPDGLICVTHFPYARVLRDPGGSVSAVIEERDCSKEQFAVREYLTSHFLFEAQALWSVLEQVHAHPVTGERYLTDVIGLLLGAGRKVQAVAIDDWRELVGLNTPEEVKWAEGVLGEE